MISNDILVTMKQLMDLHNQVEKEVVDSVGICFVNPDDLGSITSSFPYAILPNWRVHPSLLVNKGTVTIVSPDLTGESNVKDVL